MNSPILLSTAHRAIILAPHPDDDVIGAGGLIQRLLAARSELHVVFITDGENNPWPQRFMERKLFIEAGDRQKWGEMRRREAICSLARLGIGESSCTFLAFPDSGMARLARRHDTSLVDALRALFAKIEPTLIVSPSSFDLHSDHRAIAYFAHAAAGANTPVATYVVHGAGPKERLALSIELTESEKKRKHEAIECHVSQLTLSRERFLSYARPTESFFTSEFDVVRVDSAIHEWWTAFRHSIRVLFGIYPAVDSGHTPDDGLRVPRHIA